MKKRFMLLVTVLLFIMPLAAWADLSEMNDLELKYIRGTEGISLRESEAKSENEQLEEEKEVLIAALFQIFFEKVETDYFNTVLAEFIRGMRDGTIEVTDLQYAQDGASFNFIFKNFESDKLGNTDSIGFTKQYLNHRTIINGSSRHSTHN